MSKLASRGLVALTPVTDHLDAMLARLQAAAGAAGQQIAPIHAFITASDNPNAAAIDGSVYVPWTALEYLRSDHQLAALMAHEASHLILRHTDLDSVTAWFGPLSNVAMLAAAGTGIGAILVSAGGQYADKALAARWTREQELAADALGVQLMRQAGYDPIGFIDMLEVMEASVRAAPFSPLARETRLPDGRREWSIDPGALDFGEDEATHPTTAVRRRALTARLRAQAPPGTSTPPRLPDAWPDLKASVTVSSTLAGLKAASASLRSGKGNEAARRQYAAQALASPAADTYPAYIAALAAFTPTDFMALRLPLPTERLLRPGTPISGPVVLLRMALDAGDGALAARAADAIDDRYDAPPALYRWMAGAYDLRGTQIRARLADPRSPPPLGEQMALLKESLQRNLQAGRLYGQCLALARNPSQLGGCGPR